MHSSIPWEKRTPLHAQAFYNSTIEGAGIVWTVTLNVIWFSIRSIVLDPFQTI